MKLEAEAAGLRTSGPDNEIAALVQYLTHPETSELARLLPEREDHPSIGEIQLRSATRREQYPLAWLPFGLWRSDPVVAEPWTPEREIEALRTEIAIKWERCGLSLILDSLTPIELGLVDRLRAPGARAMGTWGRVQYLVATPDDIPIGKVWFYACAGTKDDFGNPLTWKDVGGPLTWADLKLDPAAFPRAVLSRQDKRAG
jgi:hypothetical protein